MNRPSIEEIRQTIKKEFQSDLSRRVDKKQFNELVQKLLKSTNNNSFDAHISEELFHQMQTIEDPPSLDVFAQVYVNAIDSINSKIYIHNNNLLVFRKQKSEIEQQKTKHFDLNSGSVEKKFVFRIIDHDISDSHKLFIRLVHENEELATGEFEIFCDGEIIVHVSPKVEQIDAQVYSNNKKDLIQKIMISLKAYEDKQRKTKRAVLTTNSETFYFDYDGQIIEGPYDYYCGLATVNARQISNTNESIDVFKNMKSQLTGLFRLNEDAFQEKANLKTETVLAESILAKKDQNQNKMTESILEGKATEGQPSGHDGFGTSIVREPKFVLSPLIQDDRELQQISNFDTFAKKNEKDDVFFRNSNTSPINNLADSPDFNFKNLKIAEMMTNFHTSPYSWHLLVHVLFYLNILLFLFSILVNLHRPSTISFIVSLGYMFWYFVRDELKNMLSANFYAACYGTGFILDILWLSATGANLISSKSKISDESLASVDQFVFVTSFFLIFAELACGVVCLTLSSTGVFVEKSDMEKKQELQIDFLR